MGFAKEDGDSGKPVRRPKDRRRESKLLLREFARTVVTDPMVQQRILQEARAGTLPARLLIELFHYLGGPPPSEVEQSLPEPTRAERRTQFRAQFARLSKDEQRQYVELCRKIQDRSETAGSHGPAAPGHEK